jgi:hypothetical protein
VPSGIDYEVMLGEGFGLDGVVMGVDGAEGESTWPPRTAPALPVLPELNRRTRSRSAFSRDGVGEFRCEA